MLGNNKIRERVSVVCTGVSDMRAKFARFDQTGLARCVPGEAFIAFDERRVLPRINREMTLVCQSPAPE